MDRLMKLLFLALFLLLPASFFAQTLKLEFTEDVTSRVGAPAFFHAKVVEEKFFSMHYFHIGNDAIVAVRRTPKGVPYPVIVTVVAGGDNVEFISSDSLPVTLVDAAGNVMGKDEQARTIRGCTTGNDVTFPAGTTVQFGNLHMDYAKYLKVRGQPLAHTPAQWVAVQQAVAQHKTASFTPSEQSNPAGPSSAMVSSNTPEAGSKDAMDPTDFEVLGVKLYMSGSEALEALKQHTHAKVGAGIEVMAHGGPGEETTTASIVFKGTTSTLKLSFIPSAPGDTSGKSERLTMIDFLSVAKTEADIKQFQASVKEKYGAPRYQIPLHMSASDFPNVADEWCPLTGELVTGYRKPVAYPYMELYETAGDNYRSGAEFRIIGSPQYKKAYDDYLAQQQAKVVQQEKEIAAVPTVSKPDFDTAVAAPPPTPPPAAKPAEVPKPVPHDMEHASFVFVRTDEPMFSHGGKPQRTYRATVISARFNTGILSYEPIKVPAGTKAEISIILNGALLVTSVLTVQLEGIIANGKHYERKNALNSCAWRSSTESHLRDSEIHSHYGGGLELDSTLTVPAGSYFFCSSFP